MPVKMSRLSPFHDSGEIDPNALPDEFQSLASDFAQTAIALCGLIFPPAAVVAIFADQFDRKKRERRLLDFMTSLLTRMKDFEEEQSKQALIAEAEKKAQSRAFREAVAVAGEEAVRTAQPDKADQFALVLVGSLTPCEQCCSKPHFKTTMNSASHI
jgi:hypothetical protein